MSCQSRITLAGGESTLNPLIDHTFVYDLMESLGPSLLYPVELSCEHVLL